MSAWLQKKKSSPAMVRVRQYNKRYFTIDFDSRVFFYTHAENSKKVASMIPFADILDVRLPESQADKGDLVSECSRASKGSSWMRRLGSGARLGEVESFVTVVVKPARTMELLCSSPAEALQWFEALKAAIADGGEGAGDHAGTGLPGSEADDGGSPTSGGAPAAGQHDPADAAAAGGDGALAAPPPTKGTFLDLTTEPEGPPGAGSGPGPGAEAVAVVDLSTGKLQASQFGFEAESSSAASSPAGSPRSGGGGPGPGGLDLAGVAEADAGQLGSQPATHRSYADQHEGLSMKERLANLEFSDEEDDGDDPLGLGKSKAA